MISDCSIRIIKIIKIKTRSQYQMNRKIIKIFVTVLIILQLIFVASATDEKKSVIITYHDQPDITILSNSDNIKHKYNAIPAVAVDVSNTELEQLKNNTNIAHIYDDVVVSLVDGTQTSDWYFNEHESITWYISRIEADKVWGPGNDSNVAPGDNAGAGVKIAILDTGIDVDHPDLEENIAGALSFVYGESPDDLYGHGTHVAGIVAAVDNEIGIIGVAPHAEIYGLNVLSSSGEGQLSDILQGLDWCIDNDIDIISMSFGNKEPLPPMDKMLDVAYNRGIVLVAAAGNNGVTVEYPAAYDSVIAVAATNATDVRSCYSSRGPEVELSAPGDYIFSTYKGGVYAMFAGTSMAAPQVSGTAALIMNTEIDSDSDLNNNNEWDPVEVRQKLRDTSVDLGDVGRDDLYGFGQVNAYAATKQANTDSPDWNPWDDDCVISNVEISMAEWHWATNTPINKHVISNAEISMLEYQWVTDDVCQEIN